MSLQVLSLCQCTTARQIIIHYHYYLFIYLFIYFLGYFFGPNLAQQSSCQKQLSAAIAFFFFFFFFFLVFSFTSFLLFLNSSPFGTIELNGRKKLTFILALYHSRDSKFRQVRCFQKSAKCFQIVFASLLQCDILDWQTTFQVVRRQQERRINCWQVKVY